MAKFVYLVVYGEVFFYICIRTRDIRFRLIIIVIRNEELHAVFGEKLAELVAKLRGERFVVRYDERGAVKIFYDVSHGKSLAGARNAQKNLSS